MTGDADVEVSAGLAAAARAISGASRVTLMCHVNPDGDALGSTLALHHVLLAAGIDSVATFPSPFVVAPHYRDLPGLDLLTEPGLIDAEPEVALTFDCGDLARLGDLETNAKAAHELAVIDHHASNARYGTINVIDVNAAASGVLVRRLIAELGLPLTRDAAICLYVALICDTGRFQYESTTCAVFKLAEELAEFDLPISSLSRTLFEENRFAYLQLTADVLARAELVADKRFVWATVTQADLAKRGVTFEEVEGMIDLVRRTREAEVSCVLKEADDGAWRVSLRSLGAVDVCRIAQNEGGGGHRFAAGFTSDDSAEEVIQRIIAAL